MGAKQIRVAAGYSQTAAAALANVSPNTWRLYESNPAAVTEGKRISCDAAVGHMAEIARQKTAA